MADQQRNTLDSANFIWNVADDVLRGNFKQHEYGDVILPFVVLRRLDCVLESKKSEVIAVRKKYSDKLDEDKLHPVLLKATGGLNFYNTSDYDLKRLTQDAKGLLLNFNNYINGFSPNVRELLENFALEKTVGKLAKNDLLFLLIDKFTEVDFHPETVSNHEVSQIFEELLRRFSEMSNETAGEHLTPREVIRLMVNLMFAEQKDELKGKGLIRSLYDPTGGTGGMVIYGKKHIKERINAFIDVVMYAQELNEQTYAIAKSDVLIMGENADNIRQGNSLSEDKFKGYRFNYMLSNPPFGVSWKNIMDFIEKEASDPNGRFSAGTPRSSDGALLFLQHMIAKMDPSGSRIAIVFNGSPLFTGDAGSGESNIRKWIIENDWLEAVVALPTELFYNTGIATYFWIVTNKKSKKRKGKVQLINAVDFYQKMKKSLGNKRNLITDEQIDKITDLFTSFKAGEYVRIFDNADFGYTKVTVERPLLKNGKSVKDKQGGIQSDPQLRDSESIPLKEDIEEYFKREVLPHVPDAWMDRDKDKVGYEISFTKYFYKYTPLRPSKEIQADILKLEKETDGLLEQIFKK
jgi:type I restriction enzyme M protein